MSTARARSATFPRLGLGTSGVALFALPINGVVQSGSWYAELGYGGRRRVGFGETDAGVLGAEAGDVVHAGAPTGPEWQLHL